MHTACTASLVVSARVAGLSVLHDVAQRDLFLAVHDVLVVREAVAARVVLLVEAERLRTRHHVAQGHRHTYKPRTKLVRKVCGCWVEASGPVSLTFQPHNFSTEHTAAVKTHEADFLFLSESEFL